MAFLQCDFINPKYSHYLATLCFDYLLGPTLENAFDCRLI
jgi:hypothetical protein